MFAAHPPKAVQLHGTTELTNTKVDGDENAQHTLIRGGRFRATGAYATRTLEDPLCSPQQAHTNPPLP